MTSPHRTRAPRSRRTPGRVVVVLAVVVATAAACASGGQRPPGLLFGPGDPSSSVGGDPDGRIGDRVATAADDDLAAIARLDPDLLAALRRATRDAARDGVAVQVTSGWRSRAYQQDLLDEAEATYGSLEEARRWVSTPEESAHTRGDAVDVGPTDAAYWMSRYGAEHGLCQVYGNEIWHYELLTEPGGTCPEPRTDGAS